MPPKKKTTSTKTTPVGSVRHNDKRANIPTEELRDFVADDEKQPKTVLYPRDSSLDPQLMWKGKAAKVATARMRARRSWRFPIRGMRRTRFVPCCAARLSTASRQCFVTRGSLPDVAAREPQVRATLCTSLRIPAQQNVSRT